MPLASYAFFFDCNASVGHYNRKPPEARWSVEHVLEDLDLAQMNGALVYHRQAVLYDAMRGNLRLMKEIGGQRHRLFPCWVAMPNLSGEFPDVDEFMGLLRQHDVSAVRLDPDRFGVPVNQRIWGELCTALREAQILCVLPGAINDTVRALLELLRDCNSLLVDAHWGDWKRVVALMDEFPHLHIEFSRFQANRAVEYFAGRFGAARCLLGTGLPEKAPGAARGFIDFTLLEKNDAALVAGRNLQRLLHGAAPHHQPEPGPWSDVLTRAACAGEPLPCLALDAHCHILHEHGIAAGGGLVFRDGDADGMIELTRRAGIDRTAIMSWAGPLSSDTDTGNEIVTQAVARYPDEFIGVATINPAYDDPEKIRQVIRQCHVELGFPGLKTYTPLQSIGYDDPLFHAWYQFGNDYDLYAVIDPDGIAREAAIRNLATRYPRLGIHLDHCGQSWAYAKWAVSLMQEFSNIWAQLNYTNVTNGVIEYLVEQVGADRVLFGTDAPMRDPRPQVSWLVFTRLLESDKRAIFGGNFAGILRRARAGLERARVALSL
jgi:predicted TIM-barrel fold metal-dependent hydrolase